MMIDIQINTLSGEPRSRSFNILSFQGGGVKDVLSATLLERLIIHKPNLIKNTSIITGSSTGSIIAAGLAFNIPIEQILEIYSYDNTQYIFTPEYSNIFRPKYNNNHLEEVINNYFPKDLTLSDLVPYIIIPAFSLGSSKKAWSPLVFNNLPGSSTAKMSVRDVLLASTACPIYLPEYQHIIDGIVYAKDPSIVAMTYALSYLGATLQNTKLLSIATANCLQSIPDNTDNWGGAEWVLGNKCSNPCVPNPILDVALAGNAYIANLFTNTLLKFKYNRIQPRLQKSISIDEYSEIPYLKLLGKSYELDTDYEWIDLYWK